VAAVPSQVTGLTLGSTTNSTQALTWTAPSANGSAITDYIVQSSTDNTNWTTFADGTSTATSATVTGLSSSTLYYYRVAAVNAIGTGAYSASVNATTSASATAPAQVTGLTLGTPKSTTQPLTWTAPSNGGSAITDYLVEYKASASGTWLTFSDGTSTATSATVTGLTASTPYDYRVSAINAVGTGTPSSTVSGSTTSSGATPVLDTYTGAQMAFGLRKLRTAYSGSAIRVRRSSDAAELDIGFVGDDLDTSALTTFVGAGDGFITKWYDQSGNTKDATPHPSVLAYYPKIVSSGTLQTRNSKPAIIFDGTDDYLTILSVTGNLANAAAFCAYAVAQTSVTTAVGMNIFYSGTNDAGSSTRFNLGRSTTNANRLRSAYRRLDADAQTALEATVDHPTTLMQLAAVHDFVDGASTIYQNGTSVFSGTAATGNSSNTSPPFTAIGCYQGIDPTRSSFWNGAISEVIIYPTDTSANAVNIGNNQKTYFGIA